MLLALLWQGKVDLRVIVHKAIARSPRLSLIKIRFQLQSKSCTGTEMQVEMAKTKRGLGSVTVHVEGKERPQDSVLNSDQNLPGFDLTAFYFPAEKCGPSAIVRKTGEEDLHAVSHEPPQKHCLMV